MAGEVPSGTGLAHRWLRQKNLFAELRALRNGEEGTVRRDEYLHVRLSPLTATLLGETVATSRYRSLSAYVRAAATGRDRAGPILAKAGALFFWARAHLGGKVSAREWEDLRDLLRPLLGPEERSSPKERSPVEERSPAEELLKTEELLRTEELREGLKLARRHLRAGQLRAEGKPFGEGDLPGAPETIRQKAAGFPETPISIRLSEARKQLIRENASYSSYDGMSSYVRHMALGWDRNGQVLAQGAAIARWVERHLGEEITSKQWERLGKAFRRRFGVFLIGAGPDGEPDVEGALRRGAEHLLGARLETIAEETQLSL